MAADEDVWLDITDHSETRWYERVEVTGERPHNKMRRWFNEAVPVGLKDDVHRARYHSPSEIVFIYTSLDKDDARGLAHEKCHRLITLYAYGPQCADRILMDHLSQCGECELLLNYTGEGTTCPWCEADLDADDVTPVPKLADHPSQRHCSQNDQPRMKAEL